MSLFKDTVANDINRVFINLDEFADYHNIDGVRVSCVVDKDVTAPAAQNLEGVMINTVTVYVKKKDIAHPVKEGERFMLDDSWHIVNNVSEESGLLTIVAEEYRQ